MPHLLANLKAGLIATLATLIASTLFIAAATGPAMTATMA